MWLSRSVLILSSPVVYRLTVGFMTIFLELAERVGMLHKHRNVEAEAAYRSAWQQYCLSRNPVVRLDLEKVMDDLQTKIAFGPTDPRWGRFIDTLPGYHDFWNNFYNDSMNFVESMMEDSDIQ